VQGLAELLGAEGRTVLEAAGIPYMIAGELRARRDVEASAPVAGFERGDSYT